MIDVIEHLVSDTDRGLLSSVTAIDLSKAFDSVDNSVLLNKLSWYGITEVSWFDYLTNRRQTVRGGVTDLPVTCGVPQGSIIGPIIFLLFTSDPPAHLTHGVLISYADDTLHIDSASSDDSGVTGLEKTCRLEKTCKIEKSGLH